MLQSCHTERARLECQLATIGQQEDGGIEQLAQVMAEKAELEQKLEKERKTFKKALGEAESYFGKVREHMLKSGP